MAKIDLGLGQASTRTSYSGTWEVTQESDLTGTPLRAWVRAAGIDEHLVLIDHTQPGPDPKLYWYHSSDMGHVAALSDDQRSVIELVRYGALGEAQILAPDGVTERTSSVIGNPYHFQGLWWDGETSTYHNRHRQYDPQSGEYLSPDPAGLWRHGQGNGYSAFGSDPWNGRDPWGLSPVDDPLGDHRRAMEDLAEWLGGHQGANTAQENPYDRYPTRGSSYLCHNPQGPSLVRAGKLVWDTVGWLTPVDDFQNGDVAIGLVGLIPLGKFFGTAFKVGRKWVKCARRGRGLTTPGKFFGDKTAEGAREALGKKFGPPRSRPGADTFFNTKTKRSFNVHTDPAHGPPHVDIRRRGPFPDRKVTLERGVD